MKDVKCVFVSKVLPHARCEETAQRENNKTGACYDAPALSGTRRAWRDSNPRPSDSKSAALSAELQARVVTSQIIVQTSAQVKP
jgi:hypothetical protein